LDHRLDYDVQRNGSVTDGQIRILVVDDDPALLDTIREYLESPGNRYVVETATRGSEALKLAARARPHVVILDVEMPGMTGVEVLASLRALDPTIPVIMLTANTDGSVAAETLKLGAVSYAPKPLDVRYLDHLVATFATKPRKGSSA
jgi:DNA-binding response OmpR family regulator